MSSEVEQEYNVKRRKKLNYNISLSVIAIISIIILVISVLMVVFL